ncbi:putative Ig domain-containing protein [Spirosoma endophyticum]|uniref:Por secretion system C-terminal sorting domain-containing protein n=1 Tax=Spirosoma endophyticum TaxID=662367 RepID=A0A1I1RLW0_9BACT|nr:putative Ig domain-containing protein [Spirosoma endophyticum]SFD35321.1 Por secretion system C-terminal sorting domain-containing protein [Spirosoma endophyticum]
MKKIALRIHLFTIGFLLNLIVPTYLLAQLPIKITNTPTTGSDPYGFVTYKGRLYFSASSSTDGPEIYSTDGTPGGTVLLKNINTLPGKGSEVGSLVIYNDKLYFGATSATGGGLWVTDGTTAGTTLVKDLSSVQFSNPILLAVANNKLFFVDKFSPSGDNKLWISDGTTAGTKLLSEALGGLDVGRGPSSMRAINNRLFYATGNTNDLWVTDGTVAGTHFVKGGEVMDGGFGSRFFNFIGQLTQFEDKLMFRGYDQSKTGDEPWISDGTPEGTYSLDLTPGAGVSLIGTYRYYNGKMYFYFPSAGLWSTDGTQAGSKQVKNVPSAERFTVFNDKLYFVSNTNELWMSDGTEAGTVLVKKLTSGLVSQMIVSGNLLYFSARTSSNNSDLELWRSDGTDAGTWKVSLFSPDATDILGKVKTLVDANGQLYFTAQPTGLSSPELYYLRPNQAPVAPVIANATGTVGQPFFQAIPSFTDPEGLPLFYSVSGLPANLTFSGGGGGIIAGTPTASGIFTITVSARDINGLTTSTTYILSINPAGGSAFALQAPTYNCATGAITFNTSGGDGSPIEYQAAGITNWTTNPYQSVDHDLITANDVQPITLQARQHGVVVTYVWDLKAYCTNPPTPQPPLPGAFTLMAPTYNCSTGAITFNTSGGDGSPIEYQAAGITSWTTNPTRFVDQELRTANDTKPLTLQARQNGKMVSYVWDLRASCSGARLAAEETTTLSVRVLGNPVAGETAAVEISGAAGQSLQFVVSDMQGRQISKDRIEQASVIQKHDVRISRAPGVYLLKVSTPTQTGTARLVRQ